MYDFDGLLASGFEEIPINSNLVCWAEWERYRDGWILCDPVFYLTKSKHTLSLKAQEVLLKHWNLERLEQFCR